MARICCPLNNGEDLMSAGANGEDLLSAGAGGNGVDMLAALDQVN